MPRVWKGVTCCTKPNATTPASSGEALTELYRLYATEAFRFAVHLTGRKEDAEDVLQQVFLQAHRHLESGADLVNPRAWLMLAVKHRVFNLQRDRRETPSDGDRARGAYYAAPTEEAAELAAVRGVLWTLPEKQHQAFVLRYWSGLSQSEIAQVLGTTASAVESLLVRARTTLISERANGSDECERVRHRLVEGDQLSDRNHDHLQKCNRCRAGHLRLSRVAEFASVVALVPSLHVAHGLAAAVPGFSAPVAAPQRRRCACGCGRIDRRRHHDRHRCLDCRLCGHRFRARWRWQSRWRLRSLRPPRRRRCSTSASLRGRQGDLPPPRCDHRCPRSTQADLPPQAAPTGARAPGRPRHGSAGIDRRVEGRRLRRQRRWQGASARPRPGRREWEGPGPGQREGEGRRKRQREWGRQRQRKRVTGNGKAKGAANGNGKAKGAANGNGQGARATARATARPRARRRATAKGRPRARRPALPRARRRARPRATRRVRATATATRPRTGNGNGNGASNGNGKGDGEAKSTS